MHQAFQLLLIVLLVCTGVTARPWRQLQQLQYVPQGQGCDGLIVTITADDESDNSWFSWGDNGPVIKGSVTLENPKQYGFPIDNIQVTAQSSDGQFYSTEAICQGGQPGTYVPVNPIPYTYGTATCAYQIQLDQRVFDSYASDLSSSSSGSSDSNSNQGSTQVSYFPSNNNQNSWIQPTWTVTAVAAIGLSNAQCPSAPAAVDTDSWWSWFVNWFSNHHNSNWGNNQSSGTSLGSSNSNGVIGSVGPSSFGTSVSDTTDTADSSSSDTSSSSSSMHDNSTDAEGSAALSDSP